MFNGYVANLGGVNTPPPIPALTIGFVLGPYNQFTFYLSRPVDAAIVVNRAFCDSKNALNGTAIGSAQMNTPFTNFPAGASGGNSQSPDTKSGDMTAGSGNHYTIYNVLINGAVALDGAIITVGSFTVKVNLTNI